MEFLTHEANLAAAAAARLLLLPCQDSAVEQAPERVAGYVVSVAITHPFISGGAALALVLGPVCGHLLKLRAERMAQLAKGASLRANDDAARTRRAERRAAVASGKLERMAAAVQEREEWLAAEREYAMRRAEVMAHRALRETELRARIEAHVARRQAEIKRNRSDYCMFMHTATAAVLFGRCARLYAAHED
eukprot:SAG11_NODE_1366_length_5104_cov_3.710090_4_plen_192_part_00